MEADERAILVTGTNGGLGLGICQRLIDDFLQTHPRSTTLRLIFTTRTASKSDATLTALLSHLSLQGPAAKSRVILQPESVDLCKLLTVRALAKKLLQSPIERLDAVILNAGFGGFTGLNWPVAWYSVAVKPIQATTWPTYKLAAVGTVTKPQLPSSSDGSSEPPLGEVFCANLFGHYMLVHYLMPLLQACPITSPGKIIWISSIEPQKTSYDANDLQCVETDKPYDHAKRLSDLLVISEQHEPSRPVDAIKSYLSPSESMLIGDRPQKSNPTFHTTHPGICATAIVEKHWLLAYPESLSFYQARWFGSPWAVLTPYKGAISSVWLALASPEEIKAKEQETGGGPAKWGSAVSRWSGVALVARTEIDGWGINGDGKPYRHTWWAGSKGRISGAIDATEEDVQEFLQQGADTWRQMEKLRLEWEDRIEKYEKSQSHVRS